MSKEKLDVTKNKAIYFILPMLGLNKSSFGAENFITCYLDKSGFIVVDTKEEINKVALEHELYVTDYTIDGITRIVFSIPEQYKHDAELFILGKYSQLSSKLKIEIGKIPNLSQKIVSMLNPQAKDRKIIADELGVDVKFIYEISSVPSESNFISIK